ncbi:uncharacterized protein LOC121869600 [Homarus americanus]|uniref:uncharacterized protein LOC121869600 n=1 Tax=Homarus americanus TaxID=6706 RepID=UPI001C449AAF|nr:uncharacterized protein LOC121869600 [Homarus americanus]
MEVLNGKGDGNKNGDYTGLENGRVEGGAKAQNGSGLDEDKEGGARRPHRDKGLVEEERVGGDEDNTDEGSELDAVLRWADRRGAYERLLVWAWVAPVCLLAPCMYMNILLMVYLPSHTCSLPPPPDSLSLDAWRNITTPRDDSGRLSSCTAP